MNDKPLAISSALAAFVASLCCLGPLLLGSVGLGAVLVATFAPLRPYLLFLSVALLALGFYSVYRKPKAAQACAGEVCALDSRSRRMAGPLLVLATVAVAALALFPVYGSKLVSGSAVRTHAAAVALQTVELRVSGMTCEVCAGVVKRKLLETSGVVAAEVDFESARARVQYAPSETSPARLIAAVNSTGYQAASLNSDTE